MGGLTYNSHPMGLAACEANIQVMLEEKMIENAASLEAVMREEMDRLIEKHPSVKGGRCKGLFGMLDIQKNAKGDLIADYNTTPKPMAELKSALLENGLFTFCRWSHIMCNPPLCITEEQLRNAYGVIDKCLEITDKVFEG